MPRDDSVGKRTPYVLPISHESAGNAGADERRQRPTVVTKPVYKD